MGNNNVDSIDWLAANISGQMKGFRHRQSLHTQSGKSVRECSTADRKSTHRSRSSSTPSNYDIYIYVTVNFGNW
jgi:hypothetical protein